MAKRETSEPTKAKKEPAVIEKSTQSTTGLTKVQREALERARARNVASQWWTPENDGDFILGVLEGRREEDSNFKEKGKPKKQTVLTLNCGPVEGIRQVSCNIVLQNEVERLKPQNGDTILVVYRGKSSGARRGKPANLFTMEVIK